MAFFWDHYQRQLAEHSERTDRLANRIAGLENELERTQKLLHDVIARLEEHVGRDATATAASAERIADASNSFKRARGTP
jgi:hypothetical protein